MENKNKNKIIIVVSLVFLMLVGGLAYWSLSGRKDGQKSPIPAEKRLTEKEVSGKILGKERCRYSDDSKTMQAAVLEADVLICDCVKDEAKKKYCQSAALDQKRYLQAIERYDLKMCEAIEAAGKKQACRGVVVSGIEHLRSTDPERLAAIFAESNNYDELIRLQEQLNQAGEANVDGLLALALAYLNKALAEHQEATYVPKAFELIEQAKKLEANNPEIFRMEGFAFEVKQDSESSLESYNKALAINPKYIPAYLGRGHAYNIFGDLNKALEDFKKAAALDGKKQVIDIYSNLCRLESTRPELFGDAISNCKIVAEAETGSVEARSDAYQILADLLIKTEKLSEAESYLLAAQAISPNDPNLKASFARLHIVNKDYVKAEAVARELIAVDGLKTAGYDLLSYALYQQGKFEEAIKTATKGLEVIDKDVSLLISSRPMTKKNLYYTLANTYHYMNDSANEEKNKRLGDEAMNVQDNQE